LYSAKIRKRQPIAIRKALSDRALVVGSPELEDTFNVWMSRVWESFLQPRRGFPAEWLGLRTLDLWLQ
jgi:hypothetical protein